VRNDDANMKRMFFNETPCIGASDMERQRDARSLSIQLDVANQASQSFTDNSAGCADNTSKTAAVAAAVTSDLAEDRDDDEDEDLSYDEQDSVGERTGNTD